MSRTIAAALGKFESPTRFAQFLRRVFRSGKVPPIKNWPANIPQPKHLKNTSYVPIVFANESDPRRVFFLNIDQRVKGAGVKKIIFSPAALRLHHHSQGIPVSQKDWEAGVQGIGLEGDHTNELALRPEHVNPKWKPNEHSFNEKPRAIYYIPSPLFEEIERHINAEQSIYQFENALKFAAGRLQVDDFVGRARLKNPRGNLLQDYVIFTQGKKPFLKSLMSAPTIEKMAEIVQKRFDISKRLAIHLAQRVQKAKEDKSLQTGWREILRITRDSRNAY